MTSNSFSNVLWKYNIEISNPLLFNHCSNITEHFMRLKANRRHRFCSGVHLSDLLARCSESGVQWAFVCTPGTMLKDHFFSQSRDFLKTVPANIFLIGHILDRKDKWFGLHPQAFFINLELWEKLGRPHPGNSDQAQNHPQVFGWNWVRSGLSANYEIINFPDMLREKKKFLYPEQNQEILLQKLNDISQPLDVLKKFSQLSSHQEAVFADLHVDAYGLDKKIFLFNTEQVRSPAQEGRIKRIDLYVGLPAGHMDMHLAHRHQLNPEAQFIYFDINQSMLEIKKEIYQTWDGKDFAKFFLNLEERRPGLFENKLITVERDELPLQWQQELSAWGGAEFFLKTYNQIRPLQKYFIRTNIIDSPELILKELERYKNLHIAFWYSNCFNYTPSLASLGWDMDRLRSSGVTFLNSLLRLSQKNNLKVTLYGEDVVEGFKLPGFGTDINDVFS